MAGEVRGDRRHQRVRDGDRQGRRAHRLPRVGAGIARGLLPGGRPRGARRRAGAVPAVRRAARQGAARVLHPARSGRRRATSSASPSGCAGPGSTAATTSALSELAGCWAGARTRTRLRAVIGHLARAGLLVPRALAARPRRGTGRRRVGPPDAGRLPGVRARRRAGPLGSVPGGVGLRRALAVPAARHCWLISATASVPRRLRRVRRAAIRVRTRVACRTVLGRPARAPPRSGAARVVAIWTMRSSRSSRSARPPVGRTRAVEILRGGRSKVIVRVRLRRASAVRRVRSPALGRRPRAGRRAARGGDPALHRRRSEVPEAPRAA